MGKSRLEAFSDGVLAILITIMVLELKTPHESDLHALAERCPVFFSYILSFVYLGIYWNNHHHLVHTVKKVSGGVMWANLHLLFWLSLIPFSMGWVGEHPTAPWPTALYGVCLLAAAVAWIILQRAIINAHGKTLERALGTDVKGKLSPILYILGIAASFYMTWIADLLYTVVAIMWVIPDRRIEKEVAATEGGES